MKKKFVHPFRKTAAMLLALASIAVSSALLGTAAYAEEESAAPALTYYVSPSGSDEGSGTVDSPFATIEKARDTIRALEERPEGGITVYLREGVYEHLTTLSFTAEDSGTKDCPITYKAYEGEHVVIDGGALLDNSKFTVPSDDILARIHDADAKAGLRAYDLAADGIDWKDPGDKSSTTSSVSIPDSRLYIDETRAYIARYPNYSVEEDIYLRFYHYEYKNFTILDTENRVKNWAEESFSTNRVYGTFGADWIANESKVTGYDPDTDRVTFSGGLDPESTLPQRFFYYNVLEEIDSYGEHFIDQDTGMMYVYLPENYAQSEIRLAQCKTTVINIEAEYMTLDGVTVKDGVNSNITIKADHVTVKNCDLSCCNGWAINARGVELTFDSNTMEYLAGGGINIASGGDKKLLIPSNNLITNNLIHDLGQIQRIYYPAINISNSIGDTISHNEIYNAPHMAVGFTALDLLIEYNYFHDICYDTGDMGVIYTYGGWDIAGLTVRNNLFKDVADTFEDPLNDYMNPMGVYLDAAAGGGQIYSNIFINVEGNAIYSCGRDNRITDNLIINCGTPININARGYYPTGLTDGGSTYEEVGPNFPSGKLWQSILSKNSLPGYATKAFGYRYPWVMLIKTTDIVDFEDKYVSYAWGDAIVANNAMYPSNKYMYISSDPARLVKFKENIYYSNLSSLGLADDSGSDYTVREDSPIYRDIPGFKPCDFKNIGLIKD